MTLARITIATSDFTPPPFYSYDDGAADPELQRFSIEKDEAFVLPAIKEALSAAGAPGTDTLRLFASPWSAPGWMKDSGVMSGGKLKPENNALYAKYLLRFIEEYERRGVHLSALTVQNEPLQNDKDYPSMKVEPPQEGEIIEALHKVFAEQGSKVVKALPPVWCFDHNWGDEWYPESLLNSSRFAPYIAATAFHHYSGQPTAMTDLHNKFPHMPIMMSEGSEFGISGASKIVSYFRNWATTYTAWVTMLDQNRKPNNGPFSAGATMVELNTKTKQVTRNFEYYMYGQFSKFVRTGAVRIGSTTPGAAGKKLEHVAFVNGPAARGAGNAGATVAVVVNAEFREQRIQLRCGEKVASTGARPPRSVATFRWQEACG